MRITFYYQDETKPKKINFIMHDVFNEKAIRREVMKIVKKRWPDAAKNIFNIDWRY